MEMMASAVDTNLSNILLMVGRSLTPIFLTFLSNNGDNRRMHFPMHCIWPVERRTKELEML